MPPKKASVSTGGEGTLTPRNIAVLCAGLRKLEGIKVNWGEVGKEPEVNIGLARNAQTAFRDALKKMGHDMKGGMGGARIFRISDEEEAPAATPKQAVKSGKATESGESENSKSVNSNGGEDEAEDKDDSDSKTPTKKRKMDADEATSVLARRSPRLRTMHEHQRQDWISNGSSSFLSEDEQGMSHRAETWIVSQREEVNENLTPKSMFAL
ncbi:uncharacterized protein AB675_1148 [Cyphellophora attinorum]|uniref:Uncharacterized protein n=1 Tax=Cyphellophora attinorum TaxID=1664694 RepID=A0A0N1NZD6_9EURO|nr:uncharacterized protein AB675_1148 [Phialophora attinorum]KPI38207.1 hypothetical protein AB675_1148 [Phialophora attinorum]